MSNKTPFIKNFTELIERLDEDKVNNQDWGFYIASDENDSIFIKLLVQPLKRNINHEEKIFLAIRSIELKQEEKGKGKFKEFLRHLENMEIDFILHDVINQRLETLLKNKKYTELKEIKNQEQLISYYHLSTLEKVKNAKAKL